MARRKSKGLSDAQGAIMSKVHKSKVFAATWLFRWQMSQGIIGVVFSALTFSGVFTLLLGPVLSELFGISYASTLLLLVVMVAVFVMSFGVFLDRVVKFWSAQALVSTVRNPFLVDRIYQKELLNLKYNSLTQLRAFYAAIDPNTTPEQRDVMLRELEVGITKMEDAIKNRRWTIDPDEHAYDDAKAL
jgi:hypothetical protein